MDNLCKSCINYQCIYQSGIKRTKCEFYIPELNYEEIKKLLEIILNREEQLNDSEKSCY